MKTWKSPYAALVSEVRGKRLAYGGSWTRLSLKLRQNNPLCQRCGIAPSDEVHHIVPLEINPALKMDPRNLLAVCRACHEHLEKGNGKKVSR
jgi:5-methylcytosine-specific restriction endonuclease McrA